MSELNIQHLFKSISLLQVRKYLAGLGWQEKETAVRWQFEKLDPESQSMRMLILPLQESHPKFRSMLPNIVFSLAVEHQREAMDIALEMSKVQVELPATKQSTNSLAATEAKEPNKPLQLEVVNSGADSMQLTLQGESPLIIAPHEAVFLTLSLSDKPLRIEAKSDLLLNTAQHAVLGKSWGFPCDLPSLDSIELLADFILKSFDRWSCPTTDADLRSELTRSVDRYLFSVEGIGSQSAELRGVLRSVAELLVAMSKKLEPSPETTTSMFRVCRSLLKPFNCTFSMNPLLPDQLWVTLREDDLETPRRSLAFLQQNIVRW